VNLLGAMAELLALLNRRVEELLLPVPARLARYLLALADEQLVPPAQTVRLPTSKRELAARLGTVPETLSRTFERLKRGGVLRINSDHEFIEIVDAEKLRRLAQE
jgi:CRP/FNR family transcriptional regulator